MAKKLYTKLFENDDYIVIDKSAGLLVIQDRYNEDIACLKNILQKEYEEIFVVHRIDRDTSGLICFAKNAEAHQHLNGKFQEGKVSKTYLALCHNQPNPSKGTIDLGITESQTQKGKMVGHKRGKKSLTKYEIEELLGSYSLLKIRIATGRTHQIRVHLSSIHCPIIADEKYGISDGFYLSQLKGRKYNHKKDQVEKPLLSRHALHAHELSFVAANGEKISVTSELHKDMRAVINQLRKFYKVID